jgi:hypothetical protein
VREQQKENRTTIWKAVGLIVSAFFIVAYISILLSRFEKDVRQEETKSLVQAMASLSDQGAAMVEEKVNASLQNIGYIAKLLEEKEDIKSDDNGGIKQDFIRAGYRLKPFWCCYPGWYQPGKYR